MGYTTDQQQLLQAAKPDFEQVRTILQGSGVWITHANMVKYRLIRPSLKMHNYSREQAGDR
jgi:hypothetical protein